MTDTADPRFVVVLGAARSGTSILRDLIAAHPAVAAVPFDVNHVWRIGAERMPDDVLSPDSLTREQAARIRGRLTHFARRAAGAAWPGKRFIVEKTVGNALRPDFVDAVLPDALYVRIVRDPRRTVPSTIAAWRSPPDPGHLMRKARMFGPADVRYAGWYAVNALRGRFSHRRGLKIWGARYAGIHDDLEACDLETVCARQWLSSVSAVDRFFAGLPDGRGISTTYEQLVAGPEALLSIWAFLGVPDAGLAARIHAQRVRPHRAAPGELPASINGETRRQIEARMAEYGYT